LNDSTTLPLSRWRAEYKRLFPDRDVRLDQVLANVWREGRQLAGWQYDASLQVWHRADGSAVTDDDGSEWRHP
jgi:hypothetical protein